jgi:hypothetical protein
MPGPVQIEWPESSFPGSNPQESMGRLINSYMEPVGDGKKTILKWIRSAGLSLFAATAKSGYRGGLIVAGNSYECWLNDASTVNAAGQVTDIGAFPGTQNVSIARNQAEPSPDVVAVDLDNGAYVLGSANVTAATATATFSGATLNIGDVIALDILNPYLSQLPASFSHTVAAGNTLTTIAASFASLINADSVLSALHITAASTGPVLTVSHQGNIGNSTSLAVAITPVGSTSFGTTVTSSISGTGNETVTISNSGVLQNEGGAATATLTVTIGGTTFTTGDVIGLQFSNSNVSTLPVSVSHTLGASESAVTIATALAAAIVAQATLATIAITATSSGAIVTITQTIGTAAVTFAPASGDLAGGQGTQGAFDGIPTVYNGFGVLPQPNSVCFQDGYFFFTCANNQVFATGINTLFMNALTFVFVQAKSDVTLLRGVAFQGLLLLFTTGSCEVYQDAALPAPNFPYTRQAVLEVGLIQTTAISGWETGFSQLLWVAQDFGVYWMTPGSGLSGGVKVSPPDLDRLIEAQVKIGNPLEAGTEITSGKKFWTLSSPAWTWEFNLQTRKWTERWSLTSAGVFGRWRARGGHPAFGKWLCGDEQTGNVLFMDDTNPTDAGTFMLWRMESLPCSKFPAMQRIAGADFNFVVGVGQAVGNVTTTVSGAAAATDGGIELTVMSTSRMQDDDIVNVNGVTGTTEANGNWPVTVIDATHLELQGSHFVDDYVSGGTAIDLTSPPNAVNPSVAISMSKDGGNTWGNPWVRSLGAQQESKNTVVQVNNLGLSGRMGPRFRMDVTDQVYVSFFSASMSSELRFPRL